MSSTAYFELVGYLGEFVLEELGLAHGGIYLLLEDLALLADVVSGDGFLLVAYAVALVVGDQALGADVGLVVLAVVLCLLLRVLQAELLDHRVVR